MKRTFPITYDFSNLQSTERGKKVNAAISQTGKVVMQTGKVVGKLIFHFPLSCVVHYNVICSNSLIVGTLPFLGGAFNSAKTAVSSWFRSWSVEEEDAAENEQQSTGEDELAEEAKESTS